MGLLRWLFGDDDNPRGYRTVTIPMANGDDVVFQGTKVCETREYGNFDDMRLTIVWEVDEDEYIVKQSSDFGGRVSGRINREQLREYYPMVRRKMGLNKKVAI